MPTMRPLRQLELLYVREPLIIIINQPRVVYGAGLSAKFIDSAGK